MLSGCKRERTAEFSYQTNIVALMPSDKLPAFDAYLSWSDFTGIEDPDQAVLMWNGKPIGKGEGGFASLMEVMNTLPSGAKILVYPSYDLPYQLDASQEVRFYPFNNNWRIMEKAVTKQRIVLYFSPRDHNGVLLPECRPPEQSHGLSGSK
jgi:hypothetical protein